MVKREQEKDEMLDQGDAGGGGDRAGLMRVVVPDNYCTQATYRRAVGRRLRTARVVLNISQQDVADAAGIALVQHLVLLPFSLHHVACFTMWPAFSA